MSGQNMYTVTFTAGLIDKLAGRQKPVKETPPPSVPRSVLHPELLALRQQDVQLSRALTSSRLKGNALLKAEDEEVAKIKDVSSGLLRKFSTPTKPLPCQQERDACLECYKSNMQDPLRCATLVDAYSACADQAFAAA